jgi:glycosyltransferase involved in cell wall biosynthesis
LKKVVLKRVAILHYASPPTIGGVESVMAYQARGLIRAGYAVRVVSGSGESFDEGVETAINTLFGSTHPQVLTIQAELAEGYISPQYHNLREQIQTALHTWLADVDVVIAHNLLTLHKNLPLTAALRRAHAEQSFQLINWCHDLAWTNPQYLPELHPGEPWELLRQPWPNVINVTVSEARQAEMAEMMGIAPEFIKVITAGIDPARFHRWTPTTSRIVDLLGLMDAYGLLLLPARLTRRKNIELGLKILAEMRQQSGRDFRLIVSGPPGPHNPKNQEYLQELLDLRKTLNLEGSAHFLYEHGEQPDEPLLIDEDTLSDFYRLSDALLFPTLQEGFGIPMLEAGITGLPIFSSDIPALTHTGRNDAKYFDPVNESPAHIAARIFSMLDTLPTFRLGVRIRSQYRWERIINDQLIPLLEEST